MEDLQIQFHQQRYISYIDIRCLTKQLYRQQDPYQHIYCPSVLKTHRIFKSMHRWIHTTMRWQGLNSVLGRDFLTIEQDNFPVPKFNAGYFLAFDHRVQMRRNLRWRVHRMLGYQHVHGMSWSWLLPHRGKVYCGVSEQSLHVLKLKEMRGNLSCEKLRWRCPASMFFLSKSVRDLYFCHLMSNMSGRVLL